MSHISQLLAIALVFLLAAMSPGPDFFAVTSRALASRRAGMQAALGIAAAIILWAALAMFGLGVLLVRVTWLYMAVRTAGALYLIYLGVRILLTVREEPQPRMTGSAATSSQSAWRSGFVVGITNPKTAAFFGSLFITVLPLDAPLWVQAAALIAVGAVSIGWFGFVALLFSTERVRAAYARIRRPVDAVLGAILVILGFRMALAQ
jgi:threonine/homoserine/homoserine lactone efflux protein